MQFALSAARKGRGNVSPGTVVGAAWVTRSGRCTASYHVRFGGAHAERRLLDRLKPRAGSGSLYLTLEPCTHHGKTPPCLERVIQARPIEVFVASLDPNPEVHGRGVEGLRKANIPVTVGVGALEAVASTPGFFLLHAEKRSWVQLKVASSLDGRIATEKGESQWITGERARRRVHRQRSQADAVVIGAGTALADDPELTVRHVDGPEPSKIVVDSRLRIDPDARLARVWRKSILQVEAKHGISHVTSDRTGNFWPTTRGYARMPRLILATVRGHGRKLEPYRAAGWEIWELPAKGNHVSLRALTSRTAKEGLLHLFVEGGPGLAGGLLGDRLVDELSVYLAPKILGGSRTWSGHYSASSLRSAREFERAAVESLGDDILWTSHRKGVLTELAKCSQDWSKNLASS